jgi:hypothetical protein
MTTAEYQNIKLIKGGLFMAPEGALPSGTPQAEKTLLDRPELRFAWSPQSRPPTEAETASYAGRPADPDWKWLYALVADGNALREAERAAHARAVAAILAGADAVCCVCGSGEVAYHNYRQQPFCWPCADGDTCPPPAPESSGTPRPYISSDGVIVTSTAVPASSPFMTVATVPASPATLAAAETVKAAAGRPAQEAAPPGGEDAREQPEEPGPATQVMDAASMHTQAMTAITPAVGGEDGAA